jgi:hypothetical protein
MWLTRERVFYAGLLGAAAERSLGGHGVYVSPAGQPNRIRIGGGAWQSGELLVVPPQVPHRVVSEEALILNLLIESESVDPAQLPDFLQHCGAVEAPDFVQRVRAAHVQLLAAAGRESFDHLDFDTLFFGRPLATRPTRRCRLRPRNARPRCNSPSRASCICSSRRSAFRFAPSAPGSGPAACCAMCESPPR